MPVILRPLDDNPFSKKFDALVAEARKVRKTAHAPYSGFLVGAALIARDGMIYCGSNIEAVDYDVTHAEESAISIMRANGSLLPAVIVAVGMRASTFPVAPIIPPCGKCRQKIHEWLLGTEHDIDVIVNDPQTLEPRLCSIRELLPLAFI
jgi:cytidine deaminase